MSGIGDDWGKCPHCGQLTAPTEWATCPFRPVPVADRLEYLREQIELESISYGEIAELQSLAHHIDPSDVVLLEWAGVPEFPDDSALHCDYCTVIETADDLTPDWNGETGNHLSCEARAFVAEHVRVVSVRV